MNVLTESLVVDDLGFGPHYVEYEQALAEQRRVHERVAEGQQPNTVLLLEHAPVYTAGRRTEDHERPSDSTPVVEVDRGGKITWHGPGQLVAYPIVRLPDPVDVIAYVRLLEDAIMATCHDLGLASACRIKGRSGVWVPADERGPARKVAAIGVRVSRGVTMHGLAINCNCDLTWFDRIVACGIRDAGVTTLSVELGRDVTVEQVSELLKGHLSSRLGAMN